MCVCVNLHGRILLSFGADGDVSMKIVMAGNAFIMAIICCSGRVRGILHLLLLLILLLFFSFVFKLHSQDLKSGQFPMAVN